MLNAIMSDKCNNCILIGSARYIDSGMKMQYSSLKNGITVLKRDLY